jgi:hypothetical protein
VQTKIEDDIVRCFGPGLQTRYAEDWVGRTLFRYRDTSFSTFIRGCALMGYKWHETNKRVKEAIFSSFCECFDPKQPFIPENLVSIILEWYAIGLSFNNLSLEVQNTIFRGIQTHFGIFQPPHLAKFLLG